jgi:hypothetical protein
MLPLQLEVTILIITINQETLMVILDYMLLLLIKDMP